MMNGHMMTPFGWFFGVFMLIFWILVIVALIYGIRWLAGQVKPGGRSSEKAPLDILKERYARGELSRDEFEKMKRDLE